MEKIQNTPQVQAQSGKKLGSLTVYTLIILSLLLNSCTAIAEIFKAGMGFGIFIVLAIFVIIAFFILRLRKK